MGVRPEDRDPAVVGPVGLQAFEDDLPVMQPDGGRIERDLAVRDHGGTVPAAVCRPVNRHHVRGERRTELDAACQYLAPPLVGLRPEKLPGEGQLITIGHARQLLPLTACVPAIRPRWPSRLHWRREKERVAYPDEASR